MSCIPRSGGCERSFTEPFANHLNVIEGSAYIHGACLDQSDSTTPQPEALYIDKESGVELVLERKSISWPVDYAYRHSADHEIADVFSQGLKDLVTDELYEIRLPMLMEGKRAELRLLAAKAVKEIRAAWATVSAGGRIRGCAGDNWRWNFGKSPSFDREPETPVSGLAVEWVQESNLLTDFLDPTRLPSDLVSSIEKILENCSKKFHAYPGRRRILLLDPHGDLRFQAPTWWGEVWASLPPPPEIGEVWAGLYDWIDDEREDWVFSQLFPL